jgi:hypothetical protein
MPPSVADAFSAPSYSPAIPRVALLSCVCLLLLLLLLLLPLLLLSCRCRLSAPWHVCVFVSGMCRDYDNAYRNPFHHSEFDDINVISAVC